MSNAKLLEYVRRVDPGAIDEYEERTLHKATRATVIDVDEPEGIMTVLGPVYAVTYTGTLQGDTHLYEHEFKGDAQPTLMVDANNRLHMVGGNYHVADVGIVDGPAEGSTRHRNPAKKQPKVTLKKQIGDDLKTTGFVEYDVIAGGEIIGILRGAELGEGAGIEWQAQGVTEHTEPDEYDTIAAIPDSANTNTAKKMVRDAYKKTDLASIVKKVDEHHRTNPKRKPRLGSGERFADCVDKMRRKPSVYDPEGLCASIGRKKYGAKKMARMAKAGRRRRRNPEMSDDQLEMMARALGEYEQRAGISEAERLKARALKGELRKKMTTHHAPQPPSAEEWVQTRASARDIENMITKIAGIGSAATDLLTDISAQISQIYLDDLNLAFDSTEHVASMMTNTGVRFGEDHGWDYVDNHGPYVTQVFNQTIEYLDSLYEAAESAMDRVQALVDEGIEDPEEIQEVMDEVVPDLERAYEETLSDIAHHIKRSKNALTADLRAARRREGNPRSRSNPGHMPFTRQEVDALKQYRGWFLMHTGHGDLRRWTKNLAEDLASGSSHYNGDWRELRAIVERHGDPRRWTWDPATTPYTLHGAARAHARSSNPHSPARDVTGRLPRGSRVANSGSLAVPQSMPNWTQDWPRVNSGALTIQQPRIYPSDLPSAVNGAAGLLGPNVCRTVPGEPIARQVNPARKQMGKWRRQKFLGQTLYLWDDDRHTATIAPYKPRPRSKASKPQNYAKMIRSAAADYETQHGSKLPKGTKYLLILSRRDGSETWPVPQVTAHKSYASAKRAAKKTLG